MPIVKVDPSDTSKANVVQVDSTAGNLWLAITEIEQWAEQNGFVRTSEYSLRQVLVEDRRRFRGTCFRLSAEEIAAAEDAQRQMIERGDRLMSRASGASSDGR